MLEVFRELILHHTLPYLTLPFVSSLHPDEILSEPYITWQCQFRWYRICKLQELPISLRYLFYFVIVNGITTDPFQFVVYVI